MARTRSCRYAFGDDPRNDDVDRGSADFHPKSGRFASNSRLLPGRGFRTSCSIAIATAQMASHGTTIGISRVGTRYSPQGRPHERRLGRSRPRRSRDHARARTVAVRTPSPKRSSHCGRTNKPYISTIARLKSGAVEVSSPVASSGEAAAAAVAAGLDRAFDFMMTGGGFPFRTRLGRETGMPRNRTGVRAVVAYGFSR